MGRLAPDDKKKLQELLAWADEDEDREEGFPRRPFEEMLRRDTRLSDMQRQWVQRMYDRVLDVPQYENLASSGKLVRGREVPTPAVLKNLPKKPPGR